LGWIHEQRRQTAGQNGVWQAGLDYDGVTVAGVGSEECRNILQYRTVEVRAQYAPDVERDGVRRQFLAIGESNPLAQLEFPGGRPERLPRGCECWSNVAVLVNRRQGIEERGMDVPRRGVPLEMRVECLGELRDHKHGA